MKNVAYMVILASACACAGRQKVQDPADTARGLYETALEDLDAGLYPEAQRGFGVVKTRFPYSAYAALADLRIADTHLQSGKYVEAIDAYRTFLKLHPNHAEASYAMFSIAEAYFEQMPGDWWLLPPAAEKDQASTRRAIVAYRDMLARFGDDALAPTAREKLRQCRRRLADHEMYVAEFYFDKGHYRAAVWRTERLLKQFPGLGLDARALWVAAQSYQKEGDLGRARNAALRLTGAFPGTPEATEAGRLLDDLRDVGIEGQTAPTGNADRARPPVPLSTQPPGGG